MSIQEKAEEKIREKLSGYKVIDMSANEDGLANIFVYDCKCPNCGSTKEGDIMYYFPDDMTRYHCCSHSHSGTPNKI